MRVPQFGHGSVRSAMPTRVSALSDNLYQLLPRTLSSWSREEQLTPSRAFASWGEALLWAPVGGATRASAVAPHRRSRTIT